MNVFERIKPVLNKIKIPEVLKKYKISSFWHKWYLAVLSGILSFVICLCVLSAYFCRTYAIGTIKNQFEVLEKDLQSVGYDFAYDDLRFFTFSPWQVMRIKNFRIYSLDDKNFFQWTLQEFNIDVGLWNLKKVGVYLGHNHTIQIGTHEWPVFLKKSDVRVRLKKGQFKEFLLSIKGVNVENSLAIKSVEAQIKHQHSPFAYLKTDIKGVIIDDATGWPLNKKIDHFYLYSTLQGDWDEDAPTSDAFYEWIDKNGYIRVNKAILNWKPLIMVANGDIRFNENADPIISLNTASLAMLETLDKLDENNFVSKKGAFVIKLLLNNKAVQQNPADKYKTVVTPLKITKDAIFLENIKLK